MSTSTVPDLLAAAVAWACVASGVWNTYCAHASLSRLQTATRSRRVGRARVDDDPASRPTIVFVVPMLCEADRVSQFAAHWGALLAGHPQLRLCVVTTERERVEAPSRRHTWDVLAAHPAMAQLLHDGRAEVLHYPAFNRTYGEQLGWALDELAGRPAPDAYVYVTNADSRLSAEACAEIIELACGGVECAQQSSLFFGNLKDVSWLAAGEAFYQSRWTVEVELFRYLVGSGQIRWVPAWLRARWYQHAVGHGLLLSVSYYRALGGLPRPTYGLEDAALGFAIRSRGGHIHPFVTLECGDAPRSFRELQRQRATWIRGPLCAVEYASRPRHAVLAGQGLFNGLKWALGVPVLCVMLYLLPWPDRLIAVAGLLLGLYGPILRLLAGLDQLEFVDANRLRPADIARGLSAYLPAAINCWLGGLRGLARLLVEVVTRRPGVQQRTREAV